MRSLLDQIAANCELPSRFFKLDHGKVLIQPDADEEFHRVDCGLTAIKRIRGTPPIVFVGNGCYVGSKC
jgi:hypothetical protein